MGFIKKTRKNMCTFIVSVLVNSGKKMFSASHKMLIS
jgi:hypothetical protein